ncbi:MAG TPA: CAP domain-containing protein [Baekduia sp.]|nr:CAP domain-containing protein [Baekduia sp.]
MRKVWATMVAAGSLAALVSTASSGAASDAPCAGADRRPTAATESRARAGVLCLLDAARAERHLPGLRSDVHAGRAAQRFAEALDPHKPLTHLGRGGTGPQDRLAQAGYAGGARKAFDAGEALGRSVGRSATPAQRVSAWLADGPTRRILLARRFRDVGLGVSVAGDRATYVVDLAAPRGPR